MDFRSLPKVFDSYDGLRERKRLDTDEHTQTRIRSVMVRKALVSRPLVAAFDSCMCLAWR